MPALPNSDWTDSKYDSKGLKLTTKAPNSPVHTVLLNWTKVAKRIDQMLLNHRFVTEDDRQHIPAFEKEHLVRSIISFADALPYENSSERDPMLQVTAFQFEAGARTIRPILDDEGQLAHLLSVMEKEAAVIPQDHRNYEYCHQLLGELKQYRDGTFTLFPDPKEPLPAEQKHSSTRETTGQLSLEDFLSNAPEDSPIAEPAGSAPPEEKLQPLRLAAQAEYNDLKEHHPEHLLGFEQHGYYEFYGEDAKIAASVLGFKLLEKELVGGGTVEVTGFRAGEWAAYAHTLWKHGHDVYLAGELPDHTHTQTKELLAKDYVPIGAELTIDGREFQVDRVDFATEKVTLTDLTFLRGMGFPISRVEPLDYIRSFVEEQSGVLEVVPPVEALWPWKAPSTVRMP